VIELSAPGEMRAWSRARRAAGARVGFVATMGYLHDGHLQLVDRARAVTDAIVMSIFVNPLQFAANEDLDRYPRDPARDRTLAAGRGVDCLFLPAAGDMYAPGAAIRVTPGALADHLCGPRRPGHFAGVLTVVAKLFHIVEPDVAVFGRKDVQQARVIARMVQDLDFPVEIVVAPTAREADGLARSSRNTYLTPAERRRAAAIPAGLADAHARFAAGERNAAALTGRLHDALAAAGLGVEYVELVDPDRLQPVETASAAAVLALAVRAGRTRLIDNIVLGDGLGADRIAQA
jgi:pantoate--beta-alanine ligase